jgi:hypothetical protein
MIEFFKPWRDELSRAYQKMPPYLNPVLDAVMSFGCGHLMIAQRCGHFDVPTEHPVIAIVGDDLDESLGPTGFHIHSIERLVRGAAADMIVSSAATDEVYGASASVAVIGRHNVIIIETRLEQGSRWLDFVNAANPWLLILLSTVTPEGIA